MRKDSTALVTGVEEDRIRSVYAKRKDGGRYSWFNPGHVFMIQERERQVLSLLRRSDFHNLQDKKILEIGCGKGHWLQDFVKWGARPENVSGVDLLPNRVEVARKACPPGVQIFCGNATRLDCPNESFDLVLQSTVFTSILDETMKQQMAGEMLRVMKKDGIILWYDYFVNNPWNSDVQGVAKKEILGLFPNCDIDLKKITLVAPLARFLLPYSWLAGFALERLKIFNTHYLGLIRKITNNTLNS